MNWKFGFLTLLMVGTLLMPNSNTLACAWSEDWEYDFYRFYEPEFSELNEYKPFNFTFDRLYDYELLTDSTSESANLDAWQRYLGSAIPRKDISAMVYGISLDELTAIQANPNGKPALEYSKNALVAEWRANRRMEVLQYLILAHQAQPYCVDIDPWGDEKGPEEGTEVGIISIAKSASKAASAPFLKLRYAYQAVRLDQYAGRPEMAIETYNQLAVPYLSADPLIGQWTMCHYAGCLRALEMEAEAAYTFSRVFDLCPSRRVHAWYGWRIWTDEIWESVQAKCKNNHEMATVYFLRGYSSVADPLDDMRQMQDLDPGTKMIEVLLLREVNKLENDLLGFPFASESNLSKRLGSNAAARELQQFVAEVLSSGKMHDRNVWQLAHTYLYFLNGDIQKASSELAEKQPTLSGEGQLKARLMDLVFRIASTKMVDRSVENTILKDYTNLSSKLGEIKSEQLRRFRDEAFAWLYEAQGEDEKALLARGRGWRLYDAPINIDLVNKMIAFEAKEDKTLYEKELLNRLGEGSHQDLLLEIKGTGLLARNSFPEAIQVFKQISETYRRDKESFQLLADPFQTATRDVVHCERCGAGKYNKLSFAEKMVDLQKQAIADPAKAPESYLFIGNGYYNTSYFGPAWNAMDFYRSGGNWYSIGEKSEWYTFDLATFEEVVDMGPAKEYYAKALNGSKEKEMSALAAFMVAKCELNESYQQGAEATFNAGLGFKLLKDTYRKTEVCRDLIKECKYLRDYVSVK
jgi:hypothetical protein